MDRDQIVTDTINFVKQTLSSAEAGHDWLHIERVYANAIRINKVENGDTFIIALAALLHDIADSKFHDGNEEKGPDIAKEFLSARGVGEADIEHVVQIIRNMSYKSSLGEITFSSKELDVVQDADRLDALGAIGIARAFTYGGYKNRKLYDFQIKPDLSMDKEAYKSSTGPTINHFYEKLLRLKDLMKTKTGKSLAEERHNFMELFLKTFYEEISLQD